MSPPHTHTPSGKPRDRALGIPIPGQPGPYNAITDVAGVSVGHTTLIRGAGGPFVDQGPVRTGATALPHEEFRELLRLTGG